MTQLGHETHVIRRISEATIDDVPAIARVHVQADWETYSLLFGSGAYAIEPRESEGRWQRALQAGDVLLTARDANKIVGVGHAQGNRIGALYVLRPHQRRGIGKTLLLRLLAILHEQGIAEARFDVVASNVNAIRFYRALGAYQVGRCISRDFRGDTENLVFAITTKRNES